MKYPAFLKEHALLQKALSPLKSFGERIIALALPPLCVACDKPVSQTHVVCPTCWSRLNFITPPVCKILGIPLSFETGDNQPLSLQAITHPPEFDHARSVVRYDEVAKTIVRRFKFSDRLDLSQFMAQQMLRVSKELLTQTDVIIPVPLHYHRLITRRYNQSMILAQHISWATKIPLEARALERIRSTKQQAGLNKSERAKNVAGAFKVKQSEKIKIAGKNILLVDDVWTTGATVNACTRALKRADAATVNIITFAHTFEEI